MLKRIVAPAIALGRVVAGLLYGVTPTDPVSLLAVALFLAAVAVLATGATTVAACGRLFRSK